MARVKITIDEAAKEVVIRMPLEPRPSASGKMILLTDSRGNQETDATYEHDGVKKSVYANINVGIYMEPKKKAGV